MNGRQNIQKKEHSLCEDCSIWSAQFEVRSAESQYDIDTHIYSKLSVIDFKLPSTQN